LPATRRLQLAATDTCLLSMRGPEHRDGARRSVLTATTATPTERMPWLQATRAGVSDSIVARVPPEPTWRVTLERAKGTSMHISSEYSAHATQSWQWQGIAEAPNPKKVAARVRM
jgi:hypothetical protein